MFPPLQTFTSAWFKVYEITRVGLRNMLSRYRHTDDGREGQEFDEEGLISSNCMTASLPFSCI